MKLSEHESQTAVWLKLEAYFKEQLESLRCQNDGDLSELDTARLRGKLSLLKTILSVAEKQEAVQAEADY